MNKKYIRFVALPALLLFSTGLVAAELISHDFDDGTMGPFTQCTTKNPNYAKVVNNKLETYWTESGYDGSRASKGAEACHEDSNGTDLLRTTKEGWMGFIINVDKSHRRDSSSGVSQIFGFENNRNIFTWEAILDLIDGDLVLTHRAGVNQHTAVDGLVYDDMPYGEDVAIIIQFVLSQNYQGKMEVWVNGESAYRTTNINFGLGNFNDNDEQYDDTYTTFKVGQYDYQNEDYVENEVRIIRYDNLSWYTGTNGYDVVNPTEYASGSGSYVSMRKANNASFAIDGNKGGANRQNVYLWPYGSGNNQNQHWEEISRGGDYYSYKKRGTNFCLDGNGGGANGQSVYLWTCSDSNQNQQWRKVQIGNNYRLEKRNASGYSLDGGNGGANGQDLYLWESSDTNQNQQWVLTDH